MKKNYFLLSCLFCFSLFFQQTAHAQGARLGIQGILKKANGNAVDDDAYSLRFRLYEQAEGGTHIWEEIQPDVDVVGGIYTAILGSVTALNVPFDTTYYLGVSVGSTSEMLPRIQLTTAPYALSLIGNTNQFPSSGLVRTDSIRVDGGIRAKGGTPGVNGANRNGYAFQPGSGDTNGDTGMFSTGENSVSLYANNTELLRASGTTVNIKSNATIDNSLTIQDQLLVNGPVSSDLNFANDRNLKYNGLDDWRLVRRDDFHSDNAGWFGTTALDNNTPADIERVTLGTFNSPLIRPTASNDYFLKKEYTLSDVGAYNYILIKFKYYHTDSWDSNDTGIGGFCTTDTGANANISWMNTAYVYSTSGKAHYAGNTGYSDGASCYEMLAYYPSTTSTAFHVFFGMRSGEGVNNERYGVGNIEVWVR
jgi:hypothetical protein